MGRRKPGVRCTYMDSTRNARECGGYAMFEVGGTYLGKRRLWTVRERFNNGRREYIILSDGNYSHKCRIHTVRGGECTKILLCGRVHAADLTLDNGAEARSRTSVPMCFTNRHNRGNDSLRSRLSTLTDIRKRKSPIGSHDGFSKYIRIRPRGIDTLSILVRGRGFEPLDR